MEVYFKLKLLNKPYVWPHGFRMETLVAILLLSKGV